MSGHSKWAQIKRQKGVADIKRGATFTKLANAITIAVRDSGIVDPQTNFKLRLAIEKARGANMPKENIQRAIDRGAGKGEKNALDEAVYEGFGPGGVAVILECVTDNKQRTLSEVKSVFDKNGGTIGQPGSVSYQFKQVGQITIRKNNMSSDDIFTKAADAGADDIEEVGDETLIYTDSGALKSTQEHLRDAGVSIVDAQLSRKPNITVPIMNKETAQKILSFIEKLEALDDVQKVYANFDIAEELL